MSPTVNMLALFGSLFLCLGLMLWVSIQCVKSLRGYLERTIMGVYIYGFGGLLLWVLVVRILYHFFGFFGG